MIKSIEAGTHSRMLIGQNGVVIIVGPADDALKAAKAVALVEQEAHSADLTEKVQSMLGISAAQTTELGGELEVSAESQPNVAPETSSEQIEEAYEEEDKSEE